MNHDQAERLAHYWAGEATDSEAVEAELSLAGDARAGELKRAWDNSALPRHLGNAEQFAARVVTAIVSSESPALARIPESPRHSIWRSAVWVVSIAVALILGGGQVGKLVEEQAATTSSSVTYTTRNAQTARVTLPDGSVVILA